MQVPSEIRMKFPVLLREQLENNKIELPDETEFEYSNICAYRCIKRNKNDNSKVTREDFQSNAELGRKMIKGESGDLTKKPEYYGVSLFQNRSELAIRLKLPQKDKKIAKGNIYREGGPILRGRNGHVCWWLYESADFDGFEIENEEA